MRRTRSHFTWSLALVLPLLLAVGCGRQMTGPTLSEGEVPLLLISNVSTAFTSTLVVEVNAPDISSPLVFNIEVKDGVASGTIEIPAGANRTITIRAIDSNGIVTHRGGITVDVVAGMNPTVDIQLDSSTGQVPLHVTFGTLGVVVEPAVAIVGVGGTVQLTATVQDAGGNILSVPVRWATLNPALATVDAAGLVTGVIKGTIPIVATYGGVGGSSVILVGAAVDQVIVEPDQATLREGDSVQLSATVLDAEGNTLPVSVTWSSSDPAVATVDAGGQVTAVSVGVADIAASSGGVGGSSVITVEAMVDQVIVEPAQATLREGKTVQLSATVLDTEGNTLLVSVAWSSSDPAVAAVDAGGLVTAVSVGVADITASYGGVVGSSVITVKTIVDRIVVEPAQVTLRDRETVQLSAMALDTEGNTLPVLVAWSTSDPAVATVNMWGLVTAVGGGTADITASVSGVEGSAALTVEAIPPTPPFAYVTDHEGHTISVIDALHRVVATIELEEGAYPRGIAITPDGAYAYVGEYGLADVAVIEIATNTVMTKIPVGTRPTGIAISPDGSRLYVSNFTDNTVSVIETAGNTVLATVNVNIDPLGLSVTPDGAYVYVANHKDRKISVIATASNTMVATIIAGDQPYDVAFRLDGVYAFVPCFGGAGSVYVIRTVDRRAVRRIDLGTGTNPSGPINIAINPVGAFAYVTKQNQDEVAVIDTVNWTVVASIPVGDAPYGVAITSDGAYAYVANLFDDTVSVIDTASNEVVATVKVGIHPQGIAITP